MATRNPPNFEQILKAIEILGGLTMFARKINVSYQTALDWKHGRRTPTPLNCMRIEKATEGKIKAEDILPDYRWEELK
jgi:DNA-binding transcriptional regulator YdaS (Cro superfamily)